MKQFILTLIVSTCISIGFAQDFKDLIVTETNDSIHCTITLLNDNNFFYDHKVKKVIVNEIMPVSKVKYYSYGGKTNVPAIQSKIETKPFTWEKTDSVTKTKAQIYSDTKMFIAITWKSAKNVIQNDDKEGGIILLKGSTTREVFYLGTTWYYVYYYNVTFRMKDNKFKIVIDNLYCESAYNSKGGVPNKIEPFLGDECPPNASMGFSTPGIPKKQAISMMASLLNDFQPIIDDYVKYINTSSKAIGEW
jgi:hypothetical protein